MKVGEVGGGREAVAIRGLQERPAFHLVVHEARRLGTYAQLPRNLSGEAEFGQNLAWAQLPGLLRRTRKSHVGGALSSEIMALFEGAPLLEGTEVERPRVARTPGSITGFPLYCCCRVGGGAILFSGLVSLPVFQNLSTPPPPRRHFGPRPPPPAFCGGGVSSESRREHSAPRGR